MPIIVLNIEIKLKTVTTEVQNIVVKVKYKVNYTFGHGFNAGSKNRTASK